MKYFSGSKNDEKIRDLYRKCTKQLNIGGTVFSGKWIELQ